MSHFYKMLPALLLVNALALMVPTSAFACCPACYEYCADGTACGSSWYCGVGRCNVFGCNCDGGCRKADTREKCTRYCAMQSREYDLRCTNGCYPPALDTCSIHCSAIAAEMREACDKDCEQRFPVGGGVSASPTGTLLGLLRFGMADTDRNGRISQEEFQSFVKSLPACGAAQPAGQPLQLFTQLDANKTQDITLDEVAPEEMAYVQKNQATIKMGQGIDSSYAQKVVAAALAGSKGAK